MFFSSTTVSMLCTLVSAFRFPILLPKFIVAYDKTFKLLSNTTLQACFAVAYGRNSACTKSFVYRRRGLRDDDDDKVERGSRKSSSANRCCSSMA